MTNSTGHQRRTAAAIGFIAIMVLVAGCGNTVNKRDFDDPPDCVTVKTYPGGASPCRPDSNTGGRGSTSTSTVGTTPPGSRPPRTLVPATAGPTTPRDATTQPGRASPLEELDRHRADWDARHPVAYRYTWANGCFCPPSATGPFIVTVRVDTQLIEPAKAGGAEPAGKVDPGIDTVFHTTREALLHADTVTVTYDPTFGFPTRVNIDWMSGAVDDEESLTVTGFTPLP